MSDNQTWLHCAVSICNLYSLELFIPIPIVVLKYKSSSGKTWSTILDVTGHTGQFNPPCIQALGHELLQLMYPITEDFDMWLEDPEGNPVESRLSDNPGFHEHDCVEKTITTDDGSQIEYRKPRSFIHIIQTGWLNGAPTTINLDACVWPPAFFLQGNNTLQVRRLTSLTERDIRSLMEEVKRFETSTEMYENAHMHITPCDKPLGIL